MKSDPNCLNCNSTPDYRGERHDININLRVLFTISCCKFKVNFITQSCNCKTLQTRSFSTPLTVTIKFTSQNLGGTWPAAARVSPRWQKERIWERGCTNISYCPRANGAECRAYCVLISPGYLHQRKWKH